MGDAEVPEVGHERAGRREAETGGQLEPVGRAELGAGVAHATRLRITSERDGTSTCVRAP